MACKSTASVAAVSDVMLQGASATKLSTAWAAATALEAQLHKKGEVDEGGRKERTNPYRYQ